LSSRGVQLGGQFRYLSQNSHGQIDTTFLPNDAQLHSDRSYFRFTDITDFKKGLRLDTDIAMVSDSSYFEDFAVGSDQTSVTFLERRADFLYYDDAWRVRGQLQNFQTIDITVPTTCPPGTSPTVPVASCNQRPYSRVPRIQANALWPVPGTHFELALDSEAVNFVRETGPTGVRLNVAPEIRWSSRGRGYFFEPAIGYDFTQYDLKDAAATGPNSSSTPTRTLPYARVDAGLVFERDAGSQGQRTQTLEPRAVYSYVPYRNQDALPIFDGFARPESDRAVFRTNRYVGRTASATPAGGAGATTRLFDHISGAQYLSATVGQIRYLPFRGWVCPRMPAQSTGLSVVTPAAVTLSLPGQALINSRGQILMARRDNTFQITFQTFAPPAQIGRPTTLHGPGG
jgi:LPS-assembly protein